MKHTIHHNTSTPPSFFRGQLLRLLLLCYMTSRATQARLQTILHMLTVDTGAAGSCPRRSRRPASARDS